MPGKDVSKVGATITPHTVAKAVAGTRTKQLRANPTGSSRTTLYEEVLLRLAVPYDPGFIPAVEQAVDEAVDQELLVCETVVGVPRLLKVPVAPKAVKVKSHRNDTSSLAGKIRSIHYAGSGAQS